MAISELANNGVEHGRNSLGSYVAVQRYPAASTLVIATSDLGKGIPEHIRVENPEWSNDGDAIARVLHSGVTGTGDPHRGNGLPSTIEEIEGSPYIAGTITIRSGHGGCRIRIPAKGKTVVDVSDEAYKKGTVVNVELRRADGAN